MERALRPTSILADFQKLLVIVPPPGWTESGEKCVGTVFQADTTSFLLGVAVTLM